MIALAESNLPKQPSKQVLRSAKAAASSPHGLINLTRLVKALDEAVDGPAEDPIALRKEWETVQYARVLLNSLRTANEQSSSTNISLEDLDSTLYRIERSYSAAVTSPSIHARKSSFGIPPVPAKVLQPEPAEKIPLPSSPAPPAPSEMMNESHPPPAAALRQRHVPNMAVTDYLRRRQEEDSAGDETGLLPLKVHHPSRPGNNQGARDALLDGARATMGSKELHEELGGQLADMSHRLKLNAIHFASSLEEEKSLLEISQDVLEKNLASTRSSKKTLTAVSKKGRGTTCMTLGVVFMVIVLFVWTYMLIRFT
ncbi:hypothetical protein BCR39DRAFT_498529 [Naematelia encephala]|uniref:Uncharacterized protein n=1 Tax=Naematelia encephala TaxID=71784 RepID=A0A1Y2AUF0_9TREE|nr:hypothetical protein BCR39DRAFT_498529 [Naematelia encephala]